DQASVDKAATEFTETGSGGLLGPGDVDYAGGAYPLTLPVYAAIASSMAASDRSTYAYLLSFISTTGPKPGFTVGPLPPGYAPLTPNLMQLVKTGIAALRSTSAPPSSPPSSQPTDGSPGSGPGAPPPSTPSDVPLGPSPSTSASD